MSHANAILTPKATLRLARCIIDDGWSLRRSAERFQVSVTTAARWAARCREHGALFSVGVNKKRVVFWHGVTILEQSITDTPAWAAGTRTH